MQKSSKTTNKMNHTKTNTRTSFKLCIVKEEFTEMITVCSEALALPTLHRKLIRLDIDLDLIRWMLKLSRLSVLLTPRETQC